VTVRRALDLIDQCDALLANLVNANPGTAMEMFYAHRRGKMVTVVGQQPFSPWVLSHSQARFQDIDRALDYLIGEPPQFDAVSWALQYEGFLSERYEQLPHSGEPDYQFLGGELPVLVIAPHATAHFREGDFHDPDAFTGSMAAALHRLARCHTLMSYYCCVADPCLHLETPMRRALADIARAGQVGMVLILLGGPGRGSPGLNAEVQGPDAAVCEDLSSRLRLKLAPLEPVGSEDSRRVAGPLCRFIAGELGLPVVILRMHRRYRMPRLQPGLFVKVLSLLKEFVEETGLEYLRSAS